MVKLIIFLFLATLNIFGQNQWQQVIATKETSLSGAAEVITIQQPASGGQQVNFIDVSVYCSVDCGFTVERDGTAATSTALTVSNTANSNDSAYLASTTNAFYSSNVGTGTVIGTYNIKAGTNVVVDLTNVWLKDGGTSRNVTLRTTSITGVVDINFRWKESK